jgi:CheY-like chemotaxis protein
MAQPQPFSWKNSHILIADDEPDMREIFSAWFRNLGCSVTEAADGKDALDALGRQSFDVVVTDVRMPRIDGVRLVQQLRQSGRYIPVVIFVSGHVDLTLPDAFDLGVEAVLSKPCEKKVLLNAAQRSLQRRNLIFEPPDAVVPPATENYVREDLQLDAAPQYLALGRGGMSLNVPQRIVPEAAIGFSLTLAEGPLTHLAGWGLLRWCESLHQGSRIGIEFLHLDDESLAQFARWLQSHAPQSFIPKDCQSHSVFSASP